MLFEGFIWGDGTPLSCEPPSTGTELCIKHGELGFLWALCFRVQSPVVGGQELHWKAAPGEEGTSLCL